MKINRFKLKLRREIGDELWNTDISALSFIILNLESTIQTPPIPRETTKDYIDRLNRNQLQTFWIELLTLKKSVVK